MKYLHFLGNINDDQWLGGIGTMLLVGFGPRSRQQIIDRHARLATMDGVKALTLDETELVDFSVRQVSIDGLATYEVAELSGKAQQEDNPVVVPGEMMKDVLLLTNEFDSLAVSDLTVSRVGTIELSVYLPDTFNGRPFQLDGGIWVSELTLGGN